MTYTSLRAAVAVAGAALLLAGCAGNPPAPQSPSAPAEITTSAAATESPSAPAASESPSETPSESPAAGAAAEHTANALAAIATAEAATEGTAFSLDWTRNRWEIELIAGNRLHEVYLSADGATITKQESERAEAEDRSLLGRAKVLMADAIATVTAATPDAMLVEADLDTRRGNVVWEIDTGTGTDRQRTYVDAVTGAVI